MKVNRRHSSFVETFQTFQGKRELHLARCRACHEILPYTQRLCQRHPASTLEWIEATGRARLHTFTEYHISYSPAHPAPYVVAMVELEEGPRLVSTVLQEAGCELRTGLELQASFDNDGRLVFIPDQS
ncbi:Zn-ribbon domain-containing OB-fold protein [Amorphus sp. MBR-141]